MRRLPQRLCHPILMERKVAMPPPDRQFAARNLQSVANYHSTKLLHEASAGNVHIFLQFAPPPGSAAEVLALGCFSRRRFPGMPLLSPWVGRLAFAGHAATERFTYIPSLLFAERIPGVPAPKFENRSLERVTVVRPVDSHSFTFMALRAGAAGRSIAPFISSETGKLPEAGGKKPRGF